MQDIISTLKNALQQAEAGLEVAVGRLAKDDTERGDFKPSEVLALACVREALAMPLTCLHQIQEPAAAEQAAWHAGLDEGRAQAAPAAVAVPLSDADIDGAVYARCPDFDAAHEGPSIDDMRAIVRAALAATPAAAPVVPDDAEIIAALEAAGVEFLKFFGGRDGKTLVHTTSGSQKASSLIAGCRALLATATGLPVQAIAEKAAQYDHLLPYLCKTCGGYGLLDRRCHDDPLGSEPCPDCNAEPQALTAHRDAAFEAVRKAFCKLQRYSFFLDDKGNVRRTPDYCGNWVEFEAVHTLFEPAAVEAALAAQATQGGEHGSR